jgi:tetratricopeptide (TPR) repeat protein/tRNA A-37 threonylcarbamoyl transferase component Bud32
MDPDRWQRLEALFHEALDLPPERREAFLREAEPDPSIRRDVLRLLEADADPETLDIGLAERLAELGPEPAGSPSLEGREVGPYRVIRRIGEGGMGAVYLAERDDVDRTVALKLVRGALAAPDLVERFLRERRVLAQLDHPNIARLLDAGVTDDETPYFAMEYVEGRPITEHCQSVGASSGARLRLFRDVCAAVSYAHANLVVHRDIKPSNVLVTDDGTVKLLDFGIAKLLDEEADATLTRTDVRVGSPAYAAPEQAAGEPITTATDVFALGILLRELLTGAREPGAGEPLSGDLEAICLRAAAPEPERRYRSAEQLRDDITRHLTGLPVEARMPTFRYRAGKFLRRHAAAVAAGLVLVLSLGGGLGAALWQGRARADAELALSRSETVTGFLTDMFEAADPRQAMGEEITARDLVDRGVERVDELEDDPLLQARILETLAGVNEQLGSYDRAGVLMERAVGLRRSLPGDSALVVALNDWGGTYNNRGLPDSAATAWAEALALSTEVLGPEHGESLALMNNLAIAYDRLGRTEEAKGLFRREIEIERRAYDADDPVRSYALSNLGLQLIWEGAYEESESLLRESLRIRLAAFGEENLGTANSLDNLGVTLREAGRYDAAEPLVRRAFEIRRAILGEEHRYFGESVFSLGTLLALRAGPGDLVASDSLLHQALDIYVSGLGTDHPGTAYVYHSLGTLARQRGDLETAETRFRQALAIRRPASRDGPMVTVQTFDALAAVLIERGEEAEALELAQEGFALAEERLPEDHPVRGAAEAQLGIALAAMGYDAAGSRFQHGITTVADRLGAGHPATRELCEAAITVGVAGAAELEVCREP